jgi:hypothetical protein
MDETQRPNVWDGNSGELFAELVRGQLDREGRTARVEVLPVKPQAAPAGAYLVDVAVQDGPGLLFEMADWIDGARVMDPHGDDLSRTEALNYLHLRCSGKSPRDALRDC